jgi:DNA-directed RNA polymerase specialized sigma24 family protein
MSVLLTTYTTRRKVMSDTKRSNVETRFKPFSPERLSSRVVGAKVSVDVEQAIRSLPAVERSAWIRRVLTEAAQRELMNNLTT